MAKRTKKLAKELDPKDDPSITYALTNSPSKTFADEVRASTDAPMTNEELAHYMSLPPHVWGMVGPAIRVFKRIEQLLGHEINPVNLYEKKAEKGSKVKDFKESKDSRITEGLLD